MRIIVNIVPSRLYALHPVSMTRRSFSDKSWLAHYRELLGIWRRKGREDGEDAAQDAVLNLLENGVGAIDDTRAYLARSASNRMVDQHRRRRIVDWLPLEALHESEHPVVPDAQAALYTQELLDALMAALRELPPSCQQAYVLHRLEGWTHAEIAQEMGVSRSMVEKHMNRALLHIQERLQKFSPN